MNEARQKGREMHMHCLLAGGAECSHGTAVEAAHQRDDRMAAGAVFIGRILAGRLDGALIGLRAGIGEEHIFKAALLAKQGS